MDYIDRVEGDFTSKQKQVLSSIITWKIIGVETTPNNLGRNESEKFIF